MSEYLEFSLDEPIGILAKQINEAMPNLVIEKFKEGLSSPKRINPRYFAKGIVTLSADDTLEAYNMGCYARMYIGSDFRMLLDLLF
jgi:hypothetical protein